MKVSKEQRNTFGVFASIFLLIAIFVTDFMTPLGIATSVAYIAAVSVAGYFSSRKVMLTITALSLLATGLGFFVTPSGLDLWIVLANRGLSIIPILVTSYLCLNRSAVKVSSSSEEDRHSIFYMAIALAVTLSALDYVLPLGIATGVSYVTVIVLAIYFSIRAQIVYIAIFCILLSVGGFIISPEGGLTETVIANRVLGIFSIILIAYLLYRRRESPKDQDQADRLTTWAAMKVVGIWKAAGILSAIALVFVVTFTVHEKAETLMGKVSHTQEVLGNLNKMLSLLQDMETGQRGFLLTGDAHYLEPMDSGTAAIQGELSLLSQLLADNPVQQNNIMSLGPLIGQKTFELNQTIKIREAEGLEAALVIVKTDVGKQVMDDIRSLINNMVAEENRLLNVRTIAFAKMRNSALIMNSIAFLLIISIFISAMRSLAGFLTFREKAGLQIVHDKAEIEQQLVELEFNKQSIEESAAAHVHLLEDFTEIKLEVEQKNLFLNEIMNNTGYGIVVFTPTLLLAAWNETFKTLMGFEGLDYKQGMPLKEFFELNSTKSNEYNMSIDEYYEEFQERIKNREQCNQYSWDRNRNGRIFNTKQNILKDGAVINSYSDVTDERKEEQRVKNMALCDGLTGLANRRSFDEHLLNACKQYDELETPFILAYLDLDNFKAVNDTHGHNAGDEVLQLVAKILKDKIRSTDLAVRLGGDEFAIIFTDSHDVEQVLNRSNAIIKAIKDVNTIVSYDINIGASAGLSLCPEDASTAVELMKLADDALYDAKEKGKGIACLASESSNLTDNTNNIKINNTNG